MGKWQETNLRFKGGEQAFKTGAEVKPKRRSKILFPRSSDPWQSGMTLKQWGLHLPSYHRADPQPRPRRIQAVGSTNCPRDIFLRAASGLNFSWDLLEPVRDFLLSFGAVLL